MFETLKSCGRTVSAAGSGLALLGIAALPMQALAHGEHADAAPSASVSATSGQVVVRDADTGKLRAPTAEEANALSASGKSNSRRAATVEPTTLSRSHWSGARGARLTDEFMSYSVVVRQADGTLATLCFETREAADAALKAAPAAKTSTLPTE